ncbi:MAG: hypothetical protein ACK4TL_13605 [Hyphomicrobiaceae bacterium]
MYHDYWLFPFSFGAGLVHWIIAAGLAALFVTALVYDAQARRWLWLFGDIALPPIGVVRGLLVWLEKI